MTDRELLQFAAKAADCGVRWEVDYGCYSVPSEHGPRRWNPLNDDGDALRLAVKLGLDVEMHGCTATMPYACAFDCAKNIAEEVEADDGDPYAATRRAIVRAAAEIAKAVP